MADIDDVEKMLNDTARGIAVLIAQRSYALWNGKEFRKLVSFESISQTEQDRIFNELEVTGLGFLQFHLQERAVSTGDESQSKFYEELGERVPVQFVENLRELGVSRKHVSLWRKLIKMRFQEYAEDLKLSYLGSARWKELQGKNTWFKSIWARIETLAIDSLHHIRRGKTDPHDPLWKVLRKWLAELEKDLTLLFRKLDEERPHLQVKH